MNQPHRLQIRVAARHYRREADLPRVCVVEAEVQALRPNTRALLAVLRQMLKDRRAECRRLPHSDEAARKLTRVRIALLGEMWARKKFDRAAVAQAAE